MERAREGGFLECARARARFGAHVVRNGNRYYQAGMPGRLGGAEAAAKPSQLHIGLTAHTYIYHGHIVV